MCEVRREHEERFEKREDEREDDDLGDEFHELAHHARHHQERREGGDGGEDSEDDGHRDLLCSIDGGFQSAFPHLVMPVDVLPDDDGVVDNDSEYDDEGEQRDQVDGRVDGRHHPDSPEERDGDAQGDPECQSEPEEERERQQHEHEAHPPVPEHQVEAAVEDTREIGPDGKRDTFWDAQLRVGDVGFDIFSDLKGVLVSDAGDLDEDGRVSVEPGEFIGFRESVNDVRDLSQAEMAAVGSGSKDQVSELIPDVSLPFGAQEDFAAVRSDGAAGQIDGGATDGVGDFVEGQTIASQRGFRDLDRNFIRPGADERHLCDAGKGGNVIPYVFSEYLQAALVGFAGHGDVDDLSSKDDLLDDGFLRFVGERVDRVDARFNIVQQTPNIVVGSDLDGDDAAVFVGGRGDLPDSLQPLDSLFDADADRFFHLGRCGPRIGDGHGDHVRGKLREDFHPELGDREQSTAQDQDHQEIGRDTIFGEPRDGALHPTPLSSVMAGRSSAMRMRMPLMTAARGETHTRSPGERPADTMICSWSARSIVMRRK